MARQWIIPGYGNIDETGTESYSIPGYGQFFEDRPLPGVDDLWQPPIYEGGGVGKTVIIPSG